MAQNLSSHLTEWLASRLPDTLDWLERMVGMNSFSTNPAGVNKLGLVTAEFFAGLGFEPEFVPSTDNRYGSHLFLRRAGRPGARTVLLVTHLDTVFPPEEEARENFVWQPAENEGRVYGPGTVDIKGGTVLIRLLLEGLQHIEPELFESTEWLVAADASEEVMSTDFATRMAERCQEGAAAVLIFEGSPALPGEYQLVTSRKGRAEFRITAEGRAAHAGSALADGVNAIVALSEILPKVDALSDAGAALTVNVATVQGGTVLNRVPHEASADLEMRAFSPEVLQQASQKIEAFRGVTANGSRILVECLGTSPAWPNDVRTQDLYRVWEEAGRQLGMKTVSLSRGGLSDANYLCHLGPTLDGLGPVGGNAHCSERSPDGSKVPEFVEIGSFVPKAALSVLALSELLRRKES